MPRTLSLVAAAVLASAAAAGPPPVSALAYRPDGTALVAGTHGRVAVIEPMSGDTLADLTGLPGRVTAMAFDKSGLLAVAAGEPSKSGVVHLYDLKQGQTPTAPRAVIAAHKDTVYAVAFSPDGATLATAGYDRTVKLWAVADPAVPPRVLTDHSDTVYAVAFHPGGKLLATAAADRAVKVWDVASGRRLYTLGDSTDWVYAVAWSPDGKRLAAAGVDKSVRVWEATADGGKLVHAVFAHERPVVRLAYSPDGGTLYTAGEDRVVKAWDAARMVEKSVFPKQPDAILSLAVRPDGKQLAVGRFDGVGLFLDPATGKPGAAFLPTKPKPLAVSKLTPNGAPRGTTVRVTIDGARLDTATGIAAAASGVTAKLVSKTAGRAVAELTVAADAAVGPVQLTVTADADIGPVLTSAAGPAAVARFFVDRFPAVAEAGVTDSARTAMSIRLPQTVVGIIDRAGDGDYFAFDAAAGQQVGVQVVTTGSKLDPQVTLTDADGRVLAEGGAGVGLVVPKAGRYSVGVRDREYRGGADFPYRLHVGPVPVVTGVFPLGVTRGREADVHIDGVNLGSPHGQTVRVRVPADAKVGSMIPLTVAGETPVGAAEVIAGEFPAVVAAGEAGADLRAVPGTADGIVGKPGDAQTVRFHAKRGERLVIEALARRYGSPLDPAIEVLDTAGKPVPRVTLRGVAKTYSTFRDHDSAVPGIRLDTWNELGVNDYLFAGSDLMRIQALPRNPDDDCQFAQADGQRVAFLDTTPTHHAQGVPMYKVEVHPPGASFPPNGLPVFALPYRNDDGGPGYGKDSRLFFDAPADGAYQVRVTDARGAGGPQYSFRLTVRPPRPDFAVSFAPQSPNVPKGGAVPVTVTATRTDGFLGPVRVKLTGLPAGFTAPEAVIEAEQMSATFPLSATAEAMTGKVPAAVEGRAGDVIRTATVGTPKAAAAGDIGVTVSAGPIRIRPGGETTFVVTIERQNGFAGRVPLDVRGLPHGVRVLNVGLNGILVTEKDTRREVFLHAEPWVTPMTRPVAVVARQEKKGVDHAAAAVLTVEP